MFSPYGDNFMRSLRRGRWRGGEGEITQTIASQFLAIVFYRLRWDGSTLQLTAGYNVSTGKRLTVSVPQHNGCLSHFQQCGDISFITPKISRYTLKKLFPNLATVIIWMSRSQWPRGLRRRSTAARLLRSWVRIPPRACMFVLWVLCVVR